METKTLMVMCPQLSQNNKMAKSMGGKPKGRPNQTILPKHLRHNQGQDARNP
jgi:hypothetical protein